MIGPRRARRITTGGPLLVVACIATACGTATTRVVVENRTAAPIDVALRSADSQAQLRLTDIPPMGRSAVRRLPFTSLASIDVQIEDGPGRGGTIQLVRGQDNLVVVYEEEPPEVDTVPREPARGPP